MDIFAKISLWYQRPGIRVLVFQLILNNLIESHSFDNNKHQFDSNCPASILKKKRHVRGWFGIIGPFQGEPLVSGPRSFHGGGGYTSQGCSLGEGYPWTGQGVVPPSTGWEGTPHLADRLRRSLTVMLEDLFVINIIIARLYNVHDMRFKLKCIPQARIYV